MKARNSILWLNCLLILVVAIVLVYQKEQLIDKGQSIFLRLAPVDPRSLIQGDYMRLRYLISQTVDDKTDLRDGFVVVQPGQNGVARYRRIHDEKLPLSDDELLLRFRQRTFNVRIGPESFFFQEGHAGFYNDACYGDFRVSGSGDALLVGLRDCDLETLGPS